MKRAGLILLFLAAPLALAKPSGPPPQLPPCMPVSLAQMSWTAKSEEALRFVPVYLPINIFKARAEVRPRKIVTLPPEKVTVTKKNKRVQVCKRRNSRRCTWWIWVTK